MIYASKYHWWIPFIIELILYCIGHPEMMDKLYAMEHFYHKNYMKALTFGGSKGLHTVAWERYPSTVWKQYPRFNFYSLRQYAKDDEFSAAQPRFKYKHPR